MISKRKALNYMTFKNYHLSIAFVAFLMVACGNDPKVIKPVSSGGSAESQTEAPGSGPATSGSEVHEVEVKDVLQAERYTYLEVEEDGEEYWIAVGKIEAEKGERYYYTGGLLKRNFYSRDFDRNFETIYLVSRITPARGASRENGGSALDQAMSKMNQPQIKEVEVEVPADAVALDDLFSDPAKYEGQTIQVRGQVMKVNNQIMNRNWVHLQDGSTMEGEKIDLTVTTDVMIPVGAVVTMQGVIALNQDFGAGYRYDIIMQEASLSE